MQSFCFFGSYPQALLSVAKRSWACTLRTRLADGKATTNNKIKEIKINKFNYGIAIV